MDFYLCGKAIVKILDWILRRFCYTDGLTFIYLTASVGLRSSECFFAPNRFMLIALSLLRFVGGA